MKKLWTLLSLCIFLFCGCDNDENDLYYTGSKASFSYSPVENSPLLMRALRNSGEFVMLLYTGSNFSISNAQGQQESITITATDYYKSMKFGISNGFIIGYPTLTELGNNEISPVCYDIVCPNCYNNYSISKRLTLGEGGFATCSSCNRTYSLNNYGIVEKGDGGRSLFRYRIYAVGSAMTINN